jgi:hypothetical protein
MALDVARAEGYGSVWLCVEPFNRAAVRSYEKAGFRRLPGTLWAPEIEMEASLACFAEGWDGRPRRCTLLAPLSRRCSRLTRMRPPGPGRDR